MPQGSTVSGVQGPDDGAKRPRLTHTYAFWSADPMLSHVLEVSRVDTEFSLPLTHPPHFPDTWTQPYQTGDPV